MPTEPETSMPKATSQQTGHVVGVWELQGVEFQPGVLGLQRYMILDIRNNGSWLDSTGDNGQWELAGDSLTLNYPDFDLSGRVVVMRGVVLSWIMDRENFKKWLSHKSMGCGTFGGAYYREGCGSGVGNDLGETVRWDFRQFSN